MNNYWMVLWYPLQIFMLLSLTACAAPPNNMSVCEGRCECVILLHGLGRTSDSMDTMSEELQKEGYSTINLDYPSREKSIETLAFETIPAGLTECRDMGGTKIHFVTHSMGGILLRYYLSKYPVQNLGRVVMLSPPNQGSEVADVLGDWQFFKWYFGPAGQQLRTRSDSLVMKLGPVNYPVGIITGDSPAFFDIWLQDIIPGPGDGKVSVARAKVDGMRDFLILPHSHSFIMEQRDVIKQTIRFLANGTFNH